MELTGKCKDDFEAWYDKYLKADSDRLISGTGIHFFNLLTDSMKWGVYVDFFYSKNHYVEVDRLLVSNFSMEYARTAAIEKANELYNNQP